MTKATKVAEPDLLGPGEQPPAAPPKGKRQQVATVQKLPPPAPTNMLAIIANAAANPAVDVGKMRELLTMQREIETEEARKAFTRDFLAMDMPSINRDGRIDEGTTRSGRQGKKTTYATFENIHRVVEPILKRGGFRLWFEPDVGEEGRIIMRGHLDHVEGHGKSCAIALPLETSGNKNNVQGIGSSISYGKRYATISLLGIRTEAPEDRDVDGNEPPGEAISLEQLAQLMEACEAKGAPVAKLIGYLNAQKNAAPVKRLADLPASRFDEAAEAIKSYGPK